MKKGQPVGMKATEANSKLHEGINDDYKQSVVRKVVSSTAEANIAIQEVFYSENKQADSFLP